MNPNIKARWLAALRSGQYQQGRRQLRKNKAYCCLGVLCDLAAQEGIGHWRNDYFTTGKEVECATLPYEIARWAGLPGNNPDIMEVPLADYNDGIDDIRPHTFAEIADLIEAHL